MSELLLDELCRRLRFVIEAEGHLFDYAYDRTRVVENARGRRWIWGNFHATVGSRDGRLKLVDWSVRPGAPVLLEQSAEGVILVYPNKDVANDIVIGLRAEMVLQELADA